LGLYLPTGLCDHEPRPGSGSLFPGDLTR